MNISVIIPTKNRHKLLKIAINSVLMQAVKPKEIIIIDGSLDRKIIMKNKDFVENNGFIYIKQDFRKYKGVAGARNQAAYIASGEYLSFLDDDDVWLDNYLSLVKKEIENGYNVIFTGIYKKKNEKIFEYKIPPKNITKDNLLVRNPGVQGSNMTVEKMFFKEINGFDDLNFSHIFEDSDFMLRALDSPKLKYKSIQKFLIVYLSHEGKRLSMTKTPFQEKGINLFYKKYKFYMTENQKNNFQQRAMQLWQTKIIK